MRRLIAAAATLTVVGVCIFAAGCQSQSNQGTKASTTTATTTTKAPRPVAEGSLKDFLLAPEQINAVMGASEMKLTRSRTAMSDDSDTMAPRECLAIDSAAQTQVYAGSGVIAMRDQTLQEGDNFAHYAEQAVVLFPTAKQAGAFFTNSAQQWGACKQYTHTQSHSEWTAGAISNANGVLSTISTQQNAMSSGWACGRSLVQRNNVIVDVNTCSADPKNSAVDIANQIAGKVPA